MDHKKLFRPFKKVLLLHGLAHAGIMGLICCALLSFAVSFVYHLLVLSPQGWLMAAVGLGGFLLGFVLCLAVRYPTQKRIARVLDQNGLQERSGTMLAFRKENDTIYRMQRKDALAHIQATDPSDIKLRIPKKRLLICAVSVVLAVCMLLIPYNILAKGGLSPQELAKQQAIGQLVEELRQQVHSANFPDEIKYKLLEIILQLEQDLMQADSQLEQAILIEQAKQDMEQVMLSGLSRIQIGAALQRFELPRQLGKAVYDSDLDLLPVVLDELEEQLLSTPANISKLKSNVSMALEDSGVEPMDLLYMAFSRFTEDLALVDRSQEDTAEQKETGIFPDEQTSTPLSDVFDRLEQNILIALDEQALLQAELEEMTVTLDNGSAALTGQTQEDEDPGVFEGGQGGNSSGSSGSGTGGGESAMGGMSSGPSNSTQTTMLEEVYDPISGSVTYGEVFAAYYAQYLEALENGEIDEALRELIDRYFSSLG